MLCMVSTDSMKEHSTKNKIKPIYAKTENKYQRSWVIVFKFYLFYNFFVKYLILMWYIFGMHVAYRQYTLASIL